jgi:hypothetical protein
MLQGNATLHINARILYEPKMRPWLALYWRQFIEGTIVNGHRLKNQQLYVESPRLHCLSIT